MNELAQIESTGGLTNWIKHNWDAILASFIASIVAAILFEVIIHGKEG